MIALVLRLAIIFHALQLKLALYELLWSLVLFYMHIKLNGIIGT